MISRYKFYEKHDIMKVLFLREINRFLSQIFESKFESKFESNFGSNFGSSPWSSPWSSPCFILCQKFNSIGLTPDTSINKPKKANVYSLRIILNTPRLVSYCMGILGVCYKSSKISNRVIEYDVLNDHSVYSRRYLFARPDRSN